MSDRSLPTLSGVLARLRAGGRGEPDLERRLNDAFARYQVRVLTVCRRELRGFSDAQIEEVAQDVLLEAWNQLDRYDPHRAPFLTFLTGITRMKCANARRRRQYLLWDDLFAEEPGSSARDALQQLTDEERDGLVQDSACAVLDDREQAVIHLRWILDYPYEDVALQLGLADGNEVRVTLQRCKRRMAREIERRVAERGHGSSFLNG
jgi:RNA polymerase sigma factor (sigma-70 family)